MKTPWTFWRRTARVVAALTGATLLGLGPAPKAQVAPPPTDDQRLEEYCAPHMGAEPTTSNGSIRRFGDYEVFLCPQGFTQLYLIAVHGVVLEINDQQEVWVDYFGDDATGTGMPVLILTVRTGAACCSVALVYEISPRRFRPLGTIDGGFGAIRWDYVPGKPSVVATVGDSTFAYWRTDAADIAIPQVRLEYHPFADEFRLAPALMTMARPSDAELQAEAALLKPKIDITARSGQRGVPYDVPPALWDRMLRLIYAGQGNLAKQFLEWAWPDDAASRTIFWHELAECNLAHSPYFEVVYYLNHWPVSRTPPAGCQNWSDLF